MATGLFLATLSIMTLAMPESAGKIVAALVQAFRAALTLLGPPLMEVNIRSRAS